VDYQTNQMVQTGEPGVYEAVIPASEINPRWDYMYLFRILDNENHGTIYPDLNRETPYIIVRLVR